MSTPPGSTFQPVNAAPFAFGFAPVATMSVPAAMPGEAVPAEADAEMYETSSVYSDSGSDSSDDDEEANDDNHYSYELFPKIRLPQKYDRKCPADDKFSIDEWLVRYVGRYNRLFTSPAEIGALSELDFASGDEDSTTGDVTKSDEDTIPEQRARDTVMDDASDSSDDDGMMGDDDDDEEEDGEWIPPGMTEEEYYKAHPALKAGLDKAKSVVNTESEMKPCRGESIACKNAFAAMGQLNPTIHTSSTEPLPSTFLNLSTSLSNRLASCIFQDNLRQCYNAATFGQVKFFNALLQHPVGFQAFSDLSCFFPKLFQRWLKASQDNVLQLLTALRTTLQLPLQSLLQFVNATFASLQHADPNLDITHTAMTAVAADAWNQAKTTSITLDSGSADPTPLHTLVHYLITPFTQTQVDQLITPHIAAIEADPTTAPLLARNFLVDNMLHLLSVLALVTKTWEDTRSELGAVFQATELDYGRVFAKSAFYAKADGCTDEDIVADCDTDDNAPAQQGPPVAGFSFAPTSGGFNCFGQVIDQQNNVNEVEKPKEKTQFDIQLHPRLIEAIFDQAVIYADPTLHGFRQNPSLIKFPQPLMSASYIKPCKHDVLETLLNHPLFHLYIHHLLHSVAPTGDSKLLTILPLLDAHHSAYNNPAPTATTTTTTTTLMELSALYPLTRHSTTVFFQRVFFMTTPQASRNWLQELVDLHRFLHDSHAQHYYRYNLRNATSFKVYDGCQGPEDPTNPGPEGGEKPHNDATDPVMPKQRPIAMNPNYYSIFLQHILECEASVSLSTDGGIMGVSAWNASPEYGSNLNLFFYHVDISGWRVQDQFKAQLAEAGEQSEGAAPMHATATQFLALHIDRLVGQSVEAVKQYLAILHQQDQTDDLSTTTTTTNDLSPTSIPPTSPDFVGHGAYSSQVLLIQTNKRIIRKIYTFANNRQRLNNDENYRIALFRSGLFPNWKLFELVRGQSIDRHPGHFHVIDLDQFRSQLDAYFLGLLHFIKNPVTPASHQVSSGFTSGFSASGFTSASGFNSGFTAGFSAGFSAGAASFHTATPVQQQKPPFSWEELTLSFVESKWADAAANSSSTATTLLPIVDLRADSDKDTDDKPLHVVDSDTGYHYNDERRMALGPSPYSIHTELKLALDVAEFIFADFNRNKAAKTPWLAFWPYFLNDRGAPSYGSIQPPSHANALATLMTMRLTIAKILNSTVASQCPSQMADVPGVGDISDGKRVAILKPWDSYPM